jgi:hypothetical protein
MTIQKRLLVLISLSIIIFGNAYAIPENAKSNPYGGGWLCNSGFKRVGDGCSKVEIPLNAKLNVYGNGWDCASGFRRVGDGCSKVEIPPNAKLNVYGNGWDCASGFRRVGDGCSKVEIPLNAKLNVYGNGWDCNKGFKIVKGSCIVMSAEEVKQMEAKEKAIIAAMAARRASLASGNSCETESRSGAEICLSVSSVDFDCSKSSFGNFYDSCEATISYDLETNYKGRGYIDVEVECRVEIEYNGRGFYSSRSDSQNKDESSSLYANGSDSETLRFDFSFSSFEQVNRAKIISHRCEIDDVNLY